MMKLKTLTLFLLFSSLSFSQVPIKPVRGTFINFAYQDERNKYMNPLSSDITNPELWKLKVKELNEMGVKYIVLMYVANESKSYYPSGFMKPAYKTSEISPVDAIINQADALDMKVFMSTGWAKNQDDNPALPETHAVMSRIMEETAKLYSQHKSFYGWYLPCEDVVGPFLSQKAVDAANAIAAEARKLTPSAKVMISPYGLKSARFDDGKYLEQISKLNVDIIAYQDEIGCVVEPMPLPHMKSNFKELRKVHDKTKIELWANDELFTWEKGLNTRPSALIPAPMPRFLSQLAGVSEAGVDEVISFAVTGILDKPDSALPLGQPVNATKAYNEYMEWKAGKGRWPLLAATFTGRVKNQAAGKDVKTLHISISANNDKLLTDEKFGTEDINDQSWLSFDNKDLIATTDMGRQTGITSLAARFMSYRLKDVYLPTAVEFSVSENGTDFITVATVTMDSYLYDRYDCWIDIALADNLKVSGRYIKVYAINGCNKSLFIDEILVNPSF